MVISLLLTYYIYGLMYPQATTQFIIIIIVYLLLDIHFMAIFYCDIFSGLNL